MEFMVMSHHVKSSIATMEAGLDNREYMHDYLREFFETAVSEGAKDPPKNYVFGDEFDQSRNTLFEKFLLDHKISGYDNIKDLSTGGYDFKAGKSWIVPTAQPQYRMVCTMFEDVKEFADSVFYDASAWTMAKAYGMPFAPNAFIKTGDQVTQVSTSSFDFPTEKAYAYLIDWSDYYAPKMLFDLQEAGVHLEMINRPFSSKTQDGATDFSAGTLMLPLGFQKLEANQLKSVVKKLAIENEQTL